MPELMHNLFNTLQTFETDGQRVHYYSLPALEAQGVGQFLSCLSAYAFYWNRC